jgi:8-oxo-dGTP pyrophosphatase MutT (NUDIX family)
MKDYNSIVGSLRENLKKDLPGLSAQIKMAPTLRTAPGFPKEPNSSTRNSAVLISIYHDNNTANTILIKRSEYIGVHSRQISFPGGKYEEFDKTILATALREAEEEIGIDSNQVEIIGSLTPLFIPISNMLVVPVVGIIPKPINLQLNLQEVEYTINVGLDHLQDPNNQSVKTICVGFLPISAPYYSVGKEVVWGATAMIISEFTELY